MHKLIQNQIRISVRNLVEFVLRGGDIDNRRSVRAEYDAMQLGSRLHRKIQGSMPKEYQAEVSLKYTAVYEQVEILLEGRADGIIRQGDELTIDEIKVIRQDMERLEEPALVHMAQAICYGYICAEQQKLREDACYSHVNIRITYCHPETEEIRRFVVPYSMDELKSEFDSYIREYGKWAQFLYRHRLERENSIRGMQFPYPYRPGQRGLVVAAYKAMLQGEQLFIQAPTGIGKTLAVLFPAVQAIGQGCADKIFYLTAKTITGTAAVSGVRIMREKGLKLTFIALVSKEKLCFCDTMDCNPVNCPYAKGHFDRVNAAVYALISAEEEITREVITQYAGEYQVCPFEMALDVTYWVDTVICDYNYVFDPHVRLQRYFAEGEQGSYLFLVDEAHNLAERARTMYSAGLEKEEFLEAKKYYQSFPGVVRRLNSCNRKLLELKRECDDWKELDGMEGIGALVHALDELQTELDRISEKHPEWTPPREASEFYFHVRDFLEVCQCLDSHYQVYMEHTSSGTFAVQLLCVNPAERLQQCCSQGISTIFFSATLLPICYYKELLCIKQDTKAIYVNSPFDKEKRMIAIAGDISTRYTRRSLREYQRIAGYIRAITGAKKGNYLVFFPSYSVLESVEAILVQEGDFPYIRQENGMTEEMREHFLENFRRLDRPVTGLCVMGGIFSEGIDLRGEAVIGVLVVGTGLPQVSVRQEILKRYYERTGMNGYNFAYLYPGMNKVLQAAGRLIRTAEDYGIVALLDERFLRAEYSSQFPVEWFPYQVMRLGDCERIAAEFWDRLKV